MIVNDRSSYLIKTDNMSSRALRKLGKKDDFPLMATEDQIEEEDSDTGENNDQQVANKKNLFQLVSD